MSMTSAIPGSGLFTKNQLRNWLAHYDLHKGFWQKLHKWIFRNDLPQIAILREFAEELDSFGVGDDQPILFVWFRTYVRNKGKEKWFNTAYLNSGSLSAQFFKDNFWFENAERLKAERRYYYQHSYILPSDYYEYHEDIQFILNYFPQAKQL